MRMPDVAVRIMDLLWDDMCNRKGFDPRNGDPLVDEETIALWRAKWVVIIREELAPDPAEE